MANLAKEADVVGRTSEYLALHARDPNAYPLNGRAVARFVPCSPETLRKYGQAERVREAKKERGGETRRTSGTVRDLKEKLKRARAEATSWQRQYEEVLERWLRIEHNVRGRTDVRMDDLLKPIPAVYREAPLPTRRGGRRMGGSEERPS